MNIVILTDELGINFELFFRFCVQRFRIGRRDVAGQRQK